MSSQATNPIRMLVVDDSALYRKFVSQVLEADERIDVVGTAVNGRVALEKIESLKPDLITLDLEMPELDGLGVLKHLQQQKSSVGAIVLSALSAEGATATTRALDAGAFDFALKPSSSSPAASIAELEHSLIPKVHAYAESKARRASRLHTASHVDAPRVVPNTTIDASKLSGNKPRVVAIGVSTGGPKALMQLIPSLPGDFPVPIVLVQHMPPMFTKTLADELNRHSRLTVVEATHGEAIKPGTVYIAPGGKHMKLIRQGFSTTVVITDEPPEKNCKPSVDYMLRSVASIYGGDSLTAILTGMGDDGAEGCQLLKKRGGTVIAQSEASCVVYGMPRQIVEHGLADCVVPLDQIGEQLVKLVGQEMAACR
ncbi:protein-glutamate methylesterase/protein-glutamine glutaminase [Aeoliella mucimassa]|uniref:Protein-glutamate methylesterase/protein-glutamine glutaminase n=1 Tax=Aeoliella mucimassa TaxID=2527972 RepID=A0A518ATG7_9BACT|nr:chemotaxis response regulator protein-glutamate methylesterase [Aeoliella mucimassa]QDU58012.1 Chemotaxis response regulator protein-glutamate methylesterase [Aeoliella mucimassa]